MKFRTTLNLIFIVLGVSGVARAQTSSDAPPLLPPVYHETGVQEDLAAVGDSVISLRSALQLAVARNPQVQAARAQIAAAQGRLQQSRYRPNPELSTEIEDFGRKNESGPAQTTIGVEQPFELFGKRGARKAVAEAELSAEQYTAQFSLLDLYQAVASAFTTALAAQDNVALALQRLELARRIEEAVRVKVSDGAVPKAELLRAQSATKLGEIDLTASEATATQARLALAALWGSGDATFRVDGSLDEWLVDPPAGADVLSIDGNPALAALQAQTRAREADIKLSKATGKPDLNLGAGYRRLHDDGSNSFLVWAAVPLPFFDRNKGGVAEATARLTQSEAELAAAGQRLNGELRQLLVGLQTQRELIVMLREQVIPPAQQAMEEIDLAYRLGSQPYINVLDAQRTLSELQGQLVDALVAGANAAIGIEQLTGHRLNPVRR
jgi:cobalt-zinc-cadmium efflux system outer membrane protein